LRNILISSQIEETNLGDTKVNWIANIFFITSIIAWSILWGLIAEKLSIFWVIIILWILAIGLISWSFLSYKKIEENKTIREKTLEYKKTYLEDFKFIIKKYFIVMLCVSLIITIWTILSQKAVEYFVEVWWKSGSSAALILLYTAAWSILWNIISMKIKNNRWLYFLIFSIIFAICCALFPTFIWNFTHTSILAVIAWVFFWITYNLLESYFFKKIADDSKKSYWSASLWIITSITIAVLMFFIDFIDKYFWFSWVYYFLGGIILFIWIIIFSLKNKLV
jgi:MFS family permease